MSLPPSHRLSRTVNKTPWQICIDSLQSSENKIFLVQPLSIVMLHFPQGFLRVFVRFPSCLALPTLLIYISCAHPLVFSCLVDPLHLWVTPSGASQPSVIITVVCHSRALPVGVKRSFFRTTRSTQRNCELLLAVWGEFSRWGSGLSSAVIVSEGMPPTPGNMDFR